MESNAQPYIVLKGEIHRRDPISAGKWKCKRAIEKFQTWRNTEVAQLSKAGDENEKKPVLSRDMDIYS